MTTNKLVQDHTPIISELVQVVNDVQFHHWNTMSYAEHMALDRTYDTLNDLKDNIVELLTGYYGRFKSIRLATIPLTTECIKLPQAIIDCGNNLKALATKDKHTDLVNISDSIIEAGGKLKYLLTLS